MFPLYSRQTNLQKASRIVEGKHLASFDSIQPLVMWLKLSVSLVRAHKLARPSRTRLLSLSLSGARLLSLPGKKKQTEKEKSTLVSYLWCRLSILSASA